MEKFESGLKEPTSKELMDWAKKRALESVEDGELEDAVISMISDLKKVKLDGNGMAEIMGMSVLADEDLTKEKVKKFIEGFN